MTWYVRTHLANPPQISALIDCIVQLVERDEKTGQEEELYKIEIPANRYDLLCVEGLARALLIFQDK